MRIAPKGLLVHGGEVYTAWFLISQQICLIHTEINRFYCIKESTLITTCTLCTCTERSTFTVVDLTPLYASKPDLQTHTWDDKVLTAKPACDCKTQRHVTFETEV